VFHLRVSDGFTVGIPGDLYGILECSSTRGAVGKLQCSEGLLALYTVDGLIAKDGCGNAMACLSLLCRLIIVGQLIV